MTLFVHLVVAYSVYNASTDLTLRLGQWGPGRMLSSLG